jgi:Flp pilus assembly protein TadD
MNRKERRASAKQLKSGRYSGAGADRAKVQHAIDLVNAGDLEQAETILTAMRRSSPNDPEVQHQLGMIYVRTGRSEAGQNLLRQAVEARPNEALYWSNLAAAYLSVEMTGPAIEAARRAVALQPVYPEAWQNLAFALRDDGKHAEAVEAFEQAGPPENMQVSSLASWGESLGQIRRLDEAERLVRQALQRAPEDPAVLTLLGWVLVEQRKHDEARDSFRRSLDINPNQFLAAFNYGVLLLRTDDKAAALRWLRRATSIDIKSAAAWRVLALELARHGHAEEALPAAERAARLNPNDESVRELLAKLKDPSPAAAEETVFDFAEPDTIGPTADPAAEKRQAEVDPLDFGTTINFGD